VTATKAPAPVYDGRTGAYWLYVSGAERWISLAAENTRLHLRNAGLSDGRPDKGLSETERALFVAQTERSVDYAGPLAGWRCGRHTMPNGVRALVTSEANAGTFDLSKGKFKEPSETLLFLERLVGAEQLTFLLGWCQAALESLRAGDFRASQLLGLAGPSGCGKSLCQAWLTELLGGRAARPYRYMVGETAFNSDLAGAEHLVIEDDSASTDIRSRRKFGAAIKTFCVNQEMSVHAKGRTAVTLKTYRRLSCSVNDEPENLVIFPPLDDSLEDKLVLLRCRNAVGDGRELKPKLDAEVSRMRRWLAEFELPAKLQSARYGVKAYQSPALTEILASVSHEERLLALVDAVIFGKNAPEEWEGTAEELESELLNSAHRASADKLFYYPAACGSFLGRLASRRPDRVEGWRTAKKRLWRVKP
jgi:hypothetical protein